MYNKVHNSYLGACAPGGAWGTPNRRSTPQSRAAALLPSAQQPHGRGLPAPVPVRTQVPCLTCPLLTPEPVPVFPLGGLQAVISMPA